MRRRCGSGGIEEGVNIYINNRGLGKEDDWNEIFTGAVIGSVIQGNTAAAQEVAAFIPKDSPTNAAVYREIRKIEQQDPSIVIPKETCTDSATDR